MCKHLLVNMIYVTVQTIRMSENFMELFWLIFKALSICVLIYDL